MSFHAKDCLGEETVVALHGTPFGVEDMALHRVHDTLEAVQVFQPCSGDDHSARLVHHIVQVGLDEVVGAFDDNAEEEVHGNDHEGLRRSSEGAAEETEQKRADVPLDHHALHVVDDKDLFHEWDTMDIPHAYKDAAAKGERVGAIPRSCFFSMGKV
jgi:hypothetical protein